MSATTTQEAKARVSLRLRLVGLFGALTKPEARKPLAASQARATLAWFAAVALLIHLVMLAALEASPKLRDPEYGRRAKALRARTAEHSARPLVLVVGTSRTAMGVRPDAWEARRPGTPRDPLLFNMGVLGGGPLVELLTVERVFADGFRPSVVLIEYWPPMLNATGKFDEWKLLDTRRLSESERSFVRDQAPDPGTIERKMRAARLNVLFARRESLLALLAPEWVPNPFRVRGAWKDLDGWGWLPGMEPEDDAQRRRLTDHFRKSFRDRFAGFAVRPDCDRRLREAVAVARAHGARVGFLFMPESAEFRGWYPPAAAAESRAHLAQLVRELDVPLINARDWMAAEDLADGHHLSRDGAAAFTPRLGAAVAVTFPDLKGSP